MVVTTKQLLITCKSQSFLRSYPAVMVNEGLSDNSNACVLPPDPTDCHANLRTCDGENPASVPRESHGCVIIFLQRDYYRTEEGSHTISANGRVISLFNLTKCLRQIVADEIFDGFQVPFYIW